MPKIIINQARCKGCELCMIACPKSCIKFDGKLNILGCHPAEFHKPDRCTGCSFCALVCPECCIEVYK